MENNKKKKKLFVIIKSDFIPFFVIVMKFGHNIIPQKKKIHVPGGGICFKTNFFIYQFVTKIFFNEK